MDQKFLFRILFESHDQLLTPQIPPLFQEIRVIKKSYLFTNGLFFSAILEN